jgi:ectoine hydroxylase-related dioxygenase (phytanoyl-CoA dioxygenase family)
MANPLIKGKAGLLEEGYGIIPGVFGGRAIAALTSALEKESHRRSKAGIRHLMSVPEVAEIASIKEMISLAKEVLGESAVPFRATLFDKSSVANWLVAWHQDTALPIRERREVSGWGPWSVKEGVVYAHAPKEALERVVALRLHLDDLDDSDLDNGPLRVLPGTQKLGLLTDEEIHRLAESIKPIDCPVAAGGVIVMRPLIIHASSKVASNRPRRVLHVEYAESTRICAELELATA